MTVDIKTWEDYFPYKPRPLQLPMLRVITKMLERQTHMVIEAANGAGKTVTALSSVIPYAKRNKKQVVYMARTHSQMDRVIDELEEISNIQQVSGIALRGRASMCINETVNKHADSTRAVQDLCSQLKTAKKCQYYNNMKDEQTILPVIEKLTSKPMTAEYIFNVTETANVCPAETARMAISDVDIVACSYLYIFDPDIRASFLESLESELEDLILIIDECHNLPDNVNNIASDDVSTFSFNRAIREANNNRQDHFVKFLETCQDYLLKTNRDVKLNREIHIDPAVFLEEIELKIDEDFPLDDEFFLDMIDMGLAIRNKLAKRGKEPRSSLGRVGEFFYKWWESIGKMAYTHSYEKKKFKDSNNYYVTLRLDALDPSIVIQPILETVHCSLHISGSIGDPEAYMMTTGVNNVKSIANIMPSPYEDNKIRALVTRKLTTTYKKRSPKMFMDMVKAISVVANHAPKNVGVFTPSYTILEKLEKHGLDRYVEKPVLLADRDMDSKMNDEMVNRFKNKADKGGALLASVLGGRSSEGADFPGDMMNAVIVVGVPFPPPNVRIKAKKKYLEDKFPGKGGDLTYTIPAVNRASQAAGRPVRGLDDEALIVFLDYRFGRRDIQLQLPEWIRSSLEVIDFDLNRLQYEVKSFFNK